MKPLLVALAGIAGLLLAVTTVALIVAVVESREFDWADEDPCRHCGSGPDADGDHSCPCPYSDAACPTH